MPTTAVYAGAVEHIMPFLTLLLSIFLVRKDTFFHSLKMQSSTLTTASVHTASVGVNIQARPAYIVNFDKI